MDLQIHSAQKLTWRDNLGTWDILPIAFGGAGMLLAFSSMKQYGIQSWYRLPYWLGAVVALASLGIYGLYMPRIRMTWIKDGQVRFRRYQGWRLRETHTFSFDTIKGVTVRDGRLYMQTDQEAICLSVRPAEDMSRLETAQREFTGFLQQGSVA